jgi:hypothetical protein
LDVALAVVPCSTKTAKPEFCLRPRAGISTTEPDVPPLDVLSEHVGAAGEKRRIHAEARV